MLTGTSLFTKLCRDPSDPALLSQLHTLTEQSDTEIHRYFAHEDASCREALTALLARRTTPARWLSRLAVAHVCTCHRLDLERLIDAPLLATLADDPLCLLILSELLNTDVAFERVGTRLRHACLLALPVEPDAEPLLAALALQEE